MWDTWQSAGKMSEAIDSRLNPNARVSLADATWSGEKLFQQGSAQMLTHRTVSKYMVAVLSH